MCVHFYLKWNQVSLAESTLTRFTDTHVSHDISFMMPALLQRMSIPPKVSTVLCKAAWRSKKRQQDEPHDPCGPPDPSCNSSMRVTSSNPVRLTNALLHIIYKRQILQIGWVKRFVCHCYATTHLIKACLLCVVHTKELPAFLAPYSHWLLSWWETVSISTACYYTNWSSGLQWHNWKTNGHTTRPATQKTKRRSLETTSIPSAKARATHLTDEEAQVTPVASSEGSPSPPTGAWTSQWRSLGWLFPSSVSILGYKNSSPL